MNDEFTRSKKIERIPIICEIEHSLVPVIECIKKEKISDELEYKEILFGDIVDLKEESILRYFKSLYFILTENSKKKIKCPIFCIKNWYPILITGQSCWDKTYLLDIIC